MERISDRHEGDLRGRLEPFTKVRPVAVSVVVAPSTAHLASTQHCAWMLINLLARAVGIVTAVRVVCPHPVPIAGRVVPLADRVLPLRDALVAGGQVIGAAPVYPGTMPQAGDTVIIVGGPHPQAAAVSGVRYASGHGWWGAVSSSPLQVAPSDSALPIGPYVAASLAAAEVYLHARLPQSAYVLVDSVGWDCWGQTLASQPMAGAPPVLTGLHLSGIALAGVGAVGTTWMHVVWATSGLSGDVTVADADEKGVTDSNLNRCPLFGGASLNQPKAPEAARISGDADVTWNPHHARFETLGARPTVLVSAVDTNRAREALQSHYPPVILSASTLDLRAETLRIGLPGQSACLRCYNTPEPFVADDELRTHLRVGGAHAVKVLAAQVHLSEADVYRWLDQPGCGETGDRLLATLRRNAREPPPRFAVGFTSVMAGTMLAAETFKLLLGQPTSAQMPDANQVTFQFLRPAAPGNIGAQLARDPRCPACDPTNPALALWRLRYEILTGIRSSLTRA